MEGIHKNIKLMERLKIMKRYRPNFIEICDTATFCQDNLRYGPGKIPITLKMKLLLKLHAFMIILQYS